MRRFQLARTRRLKVIKGKLQGSEEEEEEVEEEEEEMGGCMETPSFKCVRSLFFSVCESE